MANRERLARKDRRERRAIRARMANRERLARKVRKARKAIRARMANRERLARKDRRERRAIRVKMANRERLARKDRRERRAIRARMANRERLAHKVRRERRAIRVKMANRERLARKDRRERRAIRVKMANRERLARKDRRERRAIRARMANRERLARKVRKARKAIRARMANRERLARKDRREREGDPGKDAPQEAVLYTAQTLEDTQKAQARENIGAADEARQNILIGTETGNPVSVSDAFSAPLCGLTVYGRSTQDGTPTPDAPVPIVSAGDGGSVAVQVTGKNLLYIPDDVRTVRGVTITSKNGRISISGTATENGYVYLPVKQISIHGLALLSSNVSDPVAKLVSESWEVLFVQGKANATQRVITRVCFIVKEGTNYDSDGINVQLELGSTATSYSPYREQLLTLPTPNGLPGVPVTSGGNYTDPSGQQWVCDEVDLERGVRVQRVDKTSFDNTKTLAEQNAILSTPVETPLTPAELTDYKALATYAPNTVVQASDGAGVKLGYQKDVNITINWKPTVNQLKSDLAKKLDKSETAADSTKLAGKAPEYYIQPYNLLDNSDFVHPVAQAGVNGAHGATGYAVDRWMLTSGATVSQAADGLKIVSDKTSWTAGIQQRIEAKRFADVMTFAVRGVFPVACRLFVYIGSGTTNFGTAYFQGDAAERTLVLKLTKPDGLTGDEVVNVYISPDTGSTGTAAVVSWAALYEGEYTAETLPPYVPKGYAAELAECLRYYRRITATNETFAGYCANGVSYCMIPLQTMRMKPSLVPSGKFYYTLGNKQGTTTATATAHSANANRAVIKCAITETGILTGMISPQGDIDISADL